MNVRWKGNTLMTPVGGGIRIEPTEALTGHNLREDTKGAVKQTYGSIKPGTLDPIAGGGLS